MTGTTSATTPTSTTKKPYSRKDAHNKKKPKLNKDDRRAKYTQLARDREGRKRRMENSSHLVCYQCRQRGHAVADCPNNNNIGDGSKKKSRSSSSSTSSNSRICFKCGSTEHSLSKCPKRNEGNADDLPFCHCFICNDTGHLSSKCPQNVNGIFVNGGECKKCGSKLHTSKNCPEREKDKQRETKEKFVSGEADIDPASLLEGEGDQLPDPDAAKEKKKQKEEEESKKQKAKPRRVVNF